jgi:hypothetical protein
MPTKPRRHLIGLSALVSLAGFAAFAVAVLALMSWPSHSGEVDSERDEVIDLAFVGSVRETGTLKPMRDVQVKAEKGDRRITVRTNSEGVYKLYPNFGSDVTADQITISCAKDGYESVDVSRRRLSDKKVKDLVVAECLMAPKP